MSNHILSYIYRDELLAIMNSECISDKVRYYHGTP